MASLQLENVLRLRNLTPGKKNMDDGCNRGMYVRQKDDKSFLN